MSFGVQEKKAGNNSCFGVSLFSNVRADCTMTLDGHDKVFGYQKSMFSLCIYGGLDIYGGRMNFL